MPEQTKLIIGLGNPGPRYENTKHNVGFCVVNELMRRTRVTDVQNLGKSLVAQTEWHASTIILAKPMTYINRSGEAVAALVHQFGVEPENPCVIYDDINLDFCVLRMRPKGSHGGHNGVKSIIRALGTQAFPRLRIGIGPPEGEWIDHVLSEFSESERTQIERLVHHAADAIETFVTDGVQTTMNRFNGQIE